MQIEITDVVALSGKPGLFRIVKTDDKSIIVESLDEQARRQMVKGNMMPSKISDISIYTTTAEESENLVTVFAAIKEKYGNALPISKKSSNDELMGFLAEILPEYDTERVYPSNVKKLIAWYNILTGFEVEFVLPEPEDEEGDDSETDEAEDEDEENDKEDNKAEEETEA
jgi:hypothetical protein